MFERTLQTVDGHLKVAIPSMLNELSVGKLMALQMMPPEETNDLQVISVLSGISVEHFYNVRLLTDFDMFTDTILQLFEQVKHNYDADLLPEQVTFKIPIMKPERPKRGISLFKSHKANYETVTVKVMKNLSVEPAGAMLNARDIIADEVKRHIDIYGEDGWLANFMPSMESACKVLGHYFYCHVYGTPYDEQLADQFSEVVKQLPVTDALPIACFFFRNYPNLSRRKVSFWHRVQHYSRKRREYKRLKDLGTSTQ